MLYYLKMELLPFFTPLNVFSYITFRTFVAVFTSFLFSLAVYPSFIAFLKRVRAEQAIRDDGPQSHLIKAGTPAMGGLVLIVSVLLNLFLWTDFLIRQLSPVA